MRRGDIPALRSVDRQRDAAERAGCARMLASALAVCALLLAAIAPPPPAVSADEGWRTGWPGDQPSNVVTALVAHPGDAQVAYAATSAGVYRTGSGGASWMVLTGALGPVSALAIAPASPRTIYASAELSGSNTVLWRSDDGGQSWNSPSGGQAQPALTAVDVLVVDRTSRDTLLAGTGQLGSGYGHIVKSTDGGASWREVYAIQSVMGAGEVTALVQAPSDRQILYAGHTVYHGGALLRSGDGGESWVTLPLPNEPLAYPAALAVAPDNAQVVYAAFQYPTGSGIRLYASRDGGQSWTKVGMGLPVGAANSPRLQIDPSDGRRLFLSWRGEGAGVYGSYDRGSSWSPLGDALAPLHSVGALALSSSGRVLYAGTSAGVWQYSVPATVQWRADDRFAEYYRLHDGWRVLGGAISGPLVVNGYHAQYFEKGRIEDHSAETADRNWRFMYGLLADELQQRGVNMPVGGEVSTISYADVGRFAQSSLRVTPPAGFQGGVARHPDGSVFVPFSAQLQSQAGHNVTSRFWSYINRTDLFPGGWLHDVGLPITEPLDAVVDKGDVQGRQIVIQAFQRTVLTDDPRNPADWQVERANVGTDYLKAVGGP